MLKKALNKKPFLPCSFPQITRILAQPPLFPGSGNTPGAAPQQTAEEDTSF